MTRRQLLAALGAAAIIPAGVWRLLPSARAAGEFPLELSEAEWRKRLTPREYEVLREEDTEAPGSSELLHEKRAGVYTCAGCDQPVFRSETKFDSGTGWPSFYAPIDGAIGTREDRRLLVMVRTEVHCSRCGGHLGHVFEDGPEPTGLRYCLNGVALDFVPAGEAPA